MPTIEFLRTALKNMLGNATDNWMKRHGLLQIRSMAEWAHELKAIEDPDYTTLAGSINEELSKL